MQVAKSHYILSCTMHGNAANLDCTCLRALIVCFLLQVCSESTGHAEAVQMTYNPEEVGYDRLVDLFYSRHNSTTPNRSGNDSGTQYRSGIYYHNEEQKQVRMETCACSGCFVSGCCVQLTPSPCE